VRHDGGLRAALDLRPYGEDGDSWWVAAAVAAALADEGFLIPY
jgi:hypothetical protein